MRNPHRHPAELQRQHTDRELDRFLSKAHAGAHRRGFNREDARRRYHRHLLAIERALKQKQERAGTEHGRVFAHALDRIGNERRIHLKVAVKVVTEPASPHEAGSPRPA
jgi:hypothetical protein